MLLNYIKNLNQFDIQIGTQQNQEFGYFNDAGKRFKNDTTLIAVAIYPQIGPLDSYKKASLKVSPKGLDKVLQRDEWREHENLRISAPLYLDNLKWPRGTYTITFTRGNELVKSIDFELY
ncbi:hypothetical protein [Paenibacillus sp. MSJ-34]|uniref:hypothetical protein n=1 Tax=Paenibacillus sp. MSJ-34 TaxID=2841529 RepID=UPI001C127CEC|nr:hypothetical protein [Paenibacillus sp. MSJ-34]MBU5444840.1 hypothetical protein [Paenibacillus sp. MSJ-34]